MSRLQVRFYFELKYPFVYSKGEKNVLGGTKLQLISRLIANSIFIFVFSQHITTVNAVCFQLITFCVSQIKL